MTVPDPMDTLLMLKHGTVLPSGGSKPARNLSQEEARDLVVYYAINRLLFLQKPITFGKDGSVTFPKVGEKVELGLEIGGVHFYPSDDASAGLSKTGHMDPRMATLAVRLAQFLKNGRWAVSTIYWGGMGYGRSGSDRHGMGLALDFHGAYTRIGWIDVSFDWGRQPITLPDGSKAQKWPVNQTPYYRLDVDTNAGAFFYDVYKFLTGEAADGFGSKPTSIGDHSFILCPDMPDIAWRDKHQDHIHCEVGR